MTDEDPYATLEWPKTSGPGGRRARTQDPAPPGLECWFCRQPAVTIGYGFAVCGGREETPMNCSEKARDHFRRSVQEADRD